jgi:hypothetical protein
VEGLVRREKLLPDVLFSHSALSPRTKPKNNSELSGWKTAWATGVERCAENIPNTAENSCKHLSEWSLIIQDREVFSFQLD